MNQSGNHSHALPDSKETYLTKLSGSRRKYYLQYEPSLTDMEAFLSPNHACTKYASVLHDVHDSEVLKNYIRMITFHDWLHSLLRIRLKLRTSVTGKWKHSVLSISLVLFSVYTADSGLPVVAIPYLQYESKIRA